MSMESITDLHVHVYSIEMIISSIFKIWDIFTTSCQGRYDSRTGNQVH